MLITYAGRSAPSATLIQRQMEARGLDCTLVRGPSGDINWGRADVDTALNTDTSTVTNKRVMRELFAEHGVPIPTLVAVRDAIAAVQDGVRLIGRPDTHSQGRGLWTCSTVEDVARALCGTRRKRAATHFMYAINAEREYRAHIFMGRSIRISEKVFDHAGDYTTGALRHNVDHVRAAAKKALVAVGLDFGAVDVLANDDECWVLEVNSAPGLGGSMPRVYAEKFQDWKEAQ